MVTIYRCRKCGTNNRVDTAKRQASGHAYCGKCGYPVADFVGSEFIYQVRPAAKPRGTCGCCGGTPSAGDKLFKGFCGECWASHDGYTPSRRF